MMGGRAMPKKYYKAGEIINILRQVEILIGQGQTAQEAVRSVGISEQTYYRWRKEYGGMRTDQAQRLKELEQENTRLKRLVADLSLDNVIIKEALKVK
jgi:putative transposase